MAETKPEFQAVIMPWAGIGNEIKIGPVTIWDYRRHADEKIKDPKFREHLDKVVACYVDKRGKPTPLVAMVSHGETDFRVLTGDERDDIQQAVDGLLFSIIYPNTSDLLRFNIWTEAAPSSDRYLVYFQSFAPGDEHVAVHAGVSTDIWSIEHLRFNQPWSLGGGRTRHDDDLITAFDQILAGALPGDDRRRIMRSVEWFRLAHTQADNVHPLSKVVMMATAFETLLKIGEEDKKARFLRACVEEKFKKDDAYTDTFPKWKNVRGQPAVQVPVTFTKAAWWAKNFYDIRSDITHGDDIDPARMRFPLPTPKKTLSQLEVSDVVFGEMVVWELEERKLCSGEADAFANAVRGLTMGEVDPGPLEWNDWSIGVRHVHELDGVHRMLGWLPFRPGQKIRPADNEDEVAPV